MGLLWQVNHWRNEANLYQSEKDAHSRDIEACESNSKQAKESSHALQSRLDTINARYASLLKARRDMHIAEPTRGNDAAPSADESAWESLTIDERRLNDIQAAQLISCQGVVTYIYRENGRADLLP